MQYPIFIHKDENSVYGVIVPDLPGCYSMGDTIEDAMINAREAIECHIEGLLLDNESIPLKKPIDIHMDDPDFKEGVLAIVEIDFSKISGKTTRINVSLPVRFLKQIDEYAQQHGGNRSGFLVDAAMSYMSEHRKESDQAAR
ncbi:MAG: type II toxin-antitoxin system HicB family antitoxin [Gammaproteobacteria bacterium]